MKNRILRPPPCWLPALAMPQQVLRNARREKAKPAAKAAPPSAAPRKGAPPSPRSTAWPCRRRAREFLMQQQQQRGAPDNEQTRSAGARGADQPRGGRAGSAAARPAKTPEVQAQLDMARQEIIVGAYLRD